MLLRKQFFLDCFNFSDQLEERCWAVLAHLSVLWSIEFYLFPCELTGPPISKPHGELFTPLKLTRTRKDLSLLLREERQFWIAPIFRSVIPFVPWSTRDVLKTSFLHSMRSKMKIHWGKRLSFILKQKNARKVWVDPSMLPYGSKIFGLLQIFRSALWKVLAVLACNLSVLWSEVHLPVQTVLSTNT